MYCGRRTQFVIHIVLRSVYCSSCLFWFWNSWPFLASPWKSIQLINEDFKCCGNSLQVRIAGS
jgi:hypothetical protein